MSTFKKSMLFLHRWLGFMSGLTVFIVSITGCLYSFQDELQDLLYAHRKVKPLNQPYIEPSAFIRLAKLKYPKAKVSLLIYYGDERSMQVRMLNGKKSLSMFYNPYTGALLHVEDLDANFFAFIKKSHLYLFLPKKIGKIVNGVSVLVFVFIIISGLILWWPKNKKYSKRHFLIKWGGKWKRINYDLHNVVGFYATFFAIVLAITGLSYSFSWVSKAIYLSANAGKYYPSELKKFKSDPQNTIRYPDSAQVIDKVYRMVKKGTPHAQYLLITPGSSSTATISVTAYPKPLHFSYGDNYAFDRYSGEILSHKRYDLKSRGAKLNMMNYDIHTGQIWGLFGKIFAFLISLVCASLPITGLIIYLAKPQNRIL